MKPEHAPVLGAVLLAFDAAIGSGLSRLVITSRFTFTLGGVEERLFELPLPPLSEAAQRKLELRQREAAADAGLTGQAFAEREKLLARVPGIARGNPAQDLIGRKLVLSTAVSVEDAQRTLDEMEAWLARGTCRRMRKFGRFWRTWRLMRCLIWPARTRKRCYAI